MAAIPRYGIERLPPSRRREVIVQYLEKVVLVTMPIFDYDRAAAEWHAKERARLGRHKGQHPASRMVRSLRSQRSTN